MKSRKSQADTQGLSKPWSRQTPRHPVRGQAVQAMLLLALVLPMRSWAAKPPSESLGLWDFEQSVTNAWGGKYNVYLREPSWARTFLDPDVHRSPWGHSLRVTAHREAEGYCGLWLKLYPDSIGRRQFLDASPYQFLSLWVKGQKGGEDFELQLIDEAHANDDGSSPMRTLRAYLPKGVTTEWQEVLIPLADFRGLNLHQLTQLTLKFTTPGDYRLYLDDISLKPTRFAQLPSAHKVASQVRPDAPQETHRAMWVWNTQKLFEGPQRAGEMERFFEFCSKNRIREVFLSLDFGHPSPPGGTRFDLLNPERYREFLERAHRADLVVEGLAGTPEWAAKENHGLALAAVEAVLAFNHSAPSSRRFDGVHFDVEPYLLVGYADPWYRAQILSDFLQMVTQCADRCRTEPKLHFSCDVPAWFYPADPLEQQKLMVTFQGRDKPVGEHLTDLLDTVTIMDYRNEADGANGIIAFGTPALAYAASKGKKIVVGLETSFQPDRPVCFVCGLPVEEFHRRLVGSELRGKLYMGNFRLSTYSNGSDVHVGLEAPAQPEGATRAAFEKALISLARQLGAASDPERFPADPILEVAREALGQDPEWKGFETFEISDPETQQKIKGFRTAYRMLPKITFYGLNSEVFAEESRSVVEWFTPYPSFAGLAIHYYDSFRSLMAQ